MKFKELIENAKKILKKDSKVLHVTHRHCMDGCVCQILSKNALRNVEHYEITPQSLPQLLEYPKNNFGDFDVVLVTDVALPKNFRYFNPKVFFLDHHDSFLDNALLDNVYINDKYCSSVIFKKFLEEVLSIDLSYLNELVKLTNDHDLWKDSNEVGLQLSYMFYYYWNEKFIKRFFQGFQGFKDPEKDQIKKTENEFKSYFNSLTIYDLPKIYGSLTYGDKFINESCYKILNEEKTKIVFYINSKNSTVSIRSTIEGFHVGKYLSDTSLGGGHKFAGGLKETNKDILQKKLKELEDYLYKNFKELRKI